MGRCENMGYVIVEQDFSHSWDYLNFQFTCLIYMIIIDVEFDLQSKYSLHSTMLIRSSQAWRVLNNFTKNLSNTKHHFHQANNNFTLKFFIHAHLKYHFSLKSKAKQLILHTPQQIQLMHQRKDKKASKNQWQVFRQKTQKFKVSLIGLPNCGKSSLFNCLIGERLAIVDKEYGMTRDRREFTILNGMVTIVDTPGIEVGLLAKQPQRNNMQESPEHSRQQLKQDIFQQSLNAISESDMIFFVIDSKKQALSEEEIMLAKYLKTFNSGNNGKNCEIVLVCNKCDGTGWDQNDLINQVYSKLRIFQSKEGEENNLNDKIFYCSAEEGTGVFEILEFIDKRIPEEMREKNEKIRKERRDKFEKLVKKMKQQIKIFNQKIDAKQAAAKSQKQQEKQKNAQQDQKQQKVQSADQKQKSLKPTSKRIKIKDWESDFRKLNPNPEQNEELDYENYEDHFLRPQEAFSSSTRGVDIKNLRMKHSIKICFIGKPNVGKSSLINQLLEQDKLVVSDVPHTTRDALTTKILYKSRKIQLIDTAGLNTPRIAQNEEQYLRKSQISTMLHVQQSHVVVYVMDAFSAFKVDDFKLINRVITEGRPVVIVVNKWQSIKQQYKNKARQYLLSQLQKNLGQLHGCPIVFVSAKMVLNIDQMMDKIITTYDKWNKRISTGLLNNWLEKFKKVDNLPKDSECTLKINYIIQARVRPPHFIIFVNKKEIFKNNYMRFLMRNMAQEFELDGVPLRHTLRSTNNKENEFAMRKKSLKPKKPSKITMKMQDLKKKYGDFTI